MPNKKVYKLVLYPVNTEYTPINWLSIKSSLEKVGFIGSAISENSECNFVGERFLQLITFLGCSPEIQLEPEDGNDNNFCRIEFSDLSNNVQFRYFERDISARCPKCRKKLSHWSDWLNEWDKSSNSKSVVCEHCDGEMSLFDINWRHNAAFSRCFIDVWHIYPQEAIPTEEILSLLTSETGEQWDYFFSDCDGSA